MPLFCSGLGSVPEIRMRKEDGIMKRGPGRYNRRIYCYGQSFLDVFRLLLLRRFSSITQKEEGRKDPRMAVNSSGTSRTSGTE
jgi:hypothetical protein